MWRPPPYPITPAYRAIIPVGLLLWAGSYFAYASWVTTDYGLIGTALVVAIFGGFALGLAHLAAKVVLLRRQRRLNQALIERSLSLLRQSSYLGRRVARDNLATAARALSPRWGASSLAARRMLSFLSVDNLGNAEESAAEVAAVADRDEGQRSYALPRLMIWALPIFGFMGTVDGISVAVREFSKVMLGVTNPAQVSSALQKHLPSVTDGLATAFDTTLLGLLGSLPIMVIMSWVEQREQSHLCDLDRTWFAELVPELQRVSRNLSDAAPPSSRAQVLEIRNLSAAVDLLMRAVRELRPDKSSDAGRFVR